MPANVKNLADHRWLAQDDLADCIGNVAYWLKATPVAGGDTFTSDAAATVPVTIVGATGQTGDLLDIENQAGTKLLANLASGGVVVTPTAAANVGVKITGATGATADALSIGNAATGAQLFGVSAAGLPNLTVGATGSGSGATGTLPEIGTATGQQPLTQLAAGWIRVNINGTASWIPFWR